MFVRNFVGKADRHEASVLYHRQHMCCSCSCKLMCSLSRSTLEDALVFCTTTVAFVVALYEGKAQRAHSRIHSKFEDLRRRTAVCTATVVPYASSCSEDTAV